MSLNEGLHLLRRLILVAALALIVPVFVAPAQAAATVDSRVASFAPGPASVTSGKTITLSAQAQKAVGKQWLKTGTVTATVYFDPDGAAPNKAFSTIRSNSGGSVKLSVAASVSGKWSVRLPAQGSMKASASAQKYVKVVPAPRPTSSKPASRWDCPAWAPIKGNAPSRIYHMKGQRFFSRTTPEICFATEAAARNAGYRKSKV